MLSVSKVVQHSVQCEEKAMKKAERTRNVSNKDGHQSRLSQENSLFQIEEQNISGLHAHNFLLNSLQQGQFTKHKD